jgi:hypothetical protein
MLCLEHLQWCLDKKLDEKKSTYAGLAHEIGFGSA